MPVVQVEGLDIPSDLFPRKGLRVWVATLGEQAPLVASCGGRVHFEQSQSYRPESRPT